VTVWRDSWGIPHIRGGDVLEVAFDQGLATAQDRRWQLEIGRLRGEGRTAELVGAGGVEWDVFARRARIAETARRAYSRLTDETRGFVDAYVGGVRAGLGTAPAPELDRLGPAPGAWHPWTPLAVFLVQHIHFATYPTKLWRHHVAATVGPEAVELFRREGLPNGSNAFALGGGRTSSGQALVAGDPHRIFEAPNVYAQVGLAGPEFDVIGFAFPGVPGVQHFAHAGEVAWAVTNAMADYQDVYAERLERRGDDVWAEGPGGPERVERTVEAIAIRDGAKVEVEVLVTVRGPVVVGGPDDAEAFSLSAPSYVLGDLGFEALLSLLRARTVADVDAALEHWVEPVNNWLVADRAGRVLHRVAGRVPTRDGDDWTDWVVDLPRIEVPPDGRAVTANDRATPAFEVLSDDFAPRFRADRIATLLDAAPSMSVPAAAAVLADTKQGAGRRLLDALTGLDAPAGRLMERLRRWDRRMDAGSRDAALFVAVRAAVVDRICAADALAPLREPCPYGDLYSPWFHLPTRVAASLHLLLDREKPFGLDLEHLLADALAKVAARSPGDSWGEHHVFAPRHAFTAFGLDPGDLVPAPPDPGLSGDSDCVAATGWLPGYDGCVRGPVARYVWDLADRGRSRWAVPLGASGDPGSPHAADQFTAWSTGVLVPVSHPPEQAP